MDLDKKRIITRGSATKPSEVRYETLYEKEQRDKQELKKLFEKAKKKKKVVKKDDEIYFVAIFGSLVIAFLIAAIASV